MVKGCPSTVMVPPFCVVLELRGGSVTSVPFRLTSTWHSVVHPKKDSDWLLVLVPEEEEPEEEEEPDDPVEVDPVPACEAYGHGGQVYEYPPK